MKKIIGTLTSIAALFLLLVSPVSAHVVVKPAQVGVAAFQTFTMGVPNEKDNPTVSVRLVIPDGLQYVTPNVKPGWTITEKKSGEGESAKVTEITWTSGSIPAGQRDDFFFSAQVPANETTLNWKAYQTYQNGETVAWDHDPKASKGADDDSAPPPYSMTKVVNDLNSAAQPTDEHSMMSTNSMSESNKADKTQWASLISVAALALSIVALGMQMKRKK